MALAEERYNRRSRPSETRTLAAQCLDARVREVAYVLVVDDDQLICDLLVNIAEKFGHQANCAFTLAVALDEVSSKPYDVVFLDINMPDGSGLNILSQVRQAGSAPEVIIVTGLGDPDGAEIAIRNGAWDYIQKSSSTKEITLALIRALQYRDEKKARVPLSVLKTGGIVGSSEEIISCLDIMAQAANSDASVLIAGETGTGKELFARAIHENSSRAMHNFVVVDCTALPETLVESVLFGYEKGAFTGADRSRDGLVRQAHRGTLFLDEIGELPVSLQKTFLRVLQEHRFRAVGGESEVESDFRLVAATNQNLDKMVEGGSFRTDLLFRIRTFAIELPPLRARRKDIKELAIHFMTKFAERYKIGIKGFSPEFFDALIAYDWPGNVRELLSAMEWAITVARQEPTLFPKHLPTEIRVKLARSSVKAPVSAGEEDLTLTLRPIESYRDQMESQYLQELVAATKGDIRAACRISGLSRSRLYALLKKHNVTVSGKGNN
ncbi:MAG TPA: sigma-54 dependent transcriptional regulator [Syntrophorhabdales bacterium]|nr:sigma-54 dependent transcriptional regulator [Syntrophorhabdales bacterium]